MYNVDDKGIIMFFTFVMVNSSFQARNDPVWFPLRLVMRHIDGVPTGE
jgi:hypothetical protein